MGFLARRGGDGVSRYVYVGDDELAKIKGVDWCFANGRDTNNWIIPEHEECVEVTA